MGRRRKRARIPVSIKEAEEKKEGESKLATTSLSIQDLPSHLIMETLSRLPVKTLFICRRVCKTWNRLISDPYFAQLHVARSPFSLLVRPVPPKRETRILHLLDLHAPDTRSRDAKLKITVKANLPNIKFRLVNSCNGLICLCEFGVGDPVYICNPILGEYITLPEAQKGMYCEETGFGFCSETNQYKVVRILRQVIPSPLKSVHVYDENYETEIYTLGEGKWRSLGNAPFYMAVSFSINTSVNGAVHWLVNECKSPDYIHYFHFGSEQFGITPPPAQFRPNRKQSIGYMRLGVLESCLCVCDFTDSDHMDIWVMKNYGVKESWTKDFVIHNLIFERGNFDLYEPIIIRNNEEILMAFNEDYLVSYSTKTECFRFLRIYGIRSEFHSITLTPSFVSLKDVAKGENVKACRR